MRDGFLETPTYPTAPLWLREVTQAVVADEDSPKGVRPGDLLTIEGRSSSGWTSTV